MSIFVVKIVRFPEPLKHQMIHQIIAETTDTGLYLTIFRNYLFMVVEPSMETATFRGKIHAKGTKS